MGLDVLIVHKCDVCGVCVPFHSYEMDDADPDGWLEVPVKLPDGWDHRYEGKGKDETSMLRCQACFLAEQS